MSGAKIENVFVDISYSDLTHNQLQILGLLKMATYLKIRVVQQYTDIDSNIILDEVQGLNSTYQVKELLLIRVHDPDTNNQTTCFLKLNQNLILNPLYEISAKTGEDKIFREDQELIIGILQLFGDFLTFNKLQKFLSSLPNTDLNADINRFSLPYITSLLGRTALEGKFLISFHEDGFIEFQLKTTKTRYQKAGEVPSFPFLREFSSEGMELVYASLKYVNQISLSVLHKNVVKFEIGSERFQITKDQLVLILAWFSSKGWLRGQIMGDDLVIMELPYLWDSAMNNSAFYFSEDEYSILGYLHAVKSPTIKDIQHKLEWSDEFILGRIITVFAKSNLSGEISRSGQILLHGEVNTPQSTQIRYLSENEQQLLGLISMLGDGGVEYLAKQLNLHQSYVYQNILALVGKGLLDLTLVKDKFTVISIAEQTPVVEIDHHPNYDLRALSKSIEQRRLESENMVTVGLRKLQNMWGGQSSEFWGFLSQLHVLGYYPQVKMLNENNLQINRLYHIPKIPCYSCGSTTILNDSCEVCGKQQEHCVVCKGNISEGGIMSCPHCKRYAHKPHLMSWLNIKSVCPGCRGELTQLNVITIGEK